MDVQDPITLAQALIRCPSVTPKEAGALLLIENLLEPLGFEVHRMTFSEPGTPDVENLYARFGSKARTSVSPAIPTWCRSARRMLGHSRRSQRKFTMAFSMVAVPST